MPPHYAILIEALNRYRGKGQQKVTVEHVTVNAGGQAIVGHLNHEGGWGMLMSFAHEGAKPQRIASITLSPLGALLMVITDVLGAML